MQAIVDFANVHPILTTIIAIPAIGWSARIILELIRINCR